MKYKFLYSILLTFSLIASMGQAKNTQQQDIESIVRELDYLIHATRQLQHKYKGDKSKIRFNYVALLAQLKAAREGSKAYLNSNVIELHPAPAINRSNLTEIH